MSTSSWRELSPTTSSHIAMQSYTKSRHVTLSHHQGLSRRQFQSQMEIKREVGGITQMVLSPVTPGLLCSGGPRGRGGWTQTVLHIKKCCRVFVTCQVSEQGLQIMCVPPRLIEGNHFPLFSTAVAVYLHTPAERHTHVTIMTTTAFLQQQIYKPTVFMTVLWSA